MDGLMDTEIHAVFISFKKRTNWYIFSNVINYLSIRDVSWCCLYHCRDARIADPS